MPFSLQPATLSDIPVLAQIAHQAFESDTHTQFKTQYGNYNHEKVMTEALQSWSSRPSDRCRVTKAVDDETNNIIGWVTWGYRIRHQDGNTNSDTNKNTKDVESSSAKAQGRTFQTGTSHDRPLARLESTTSTDLQDWMTKLMASGDPCMYIMSIVVSPAHQSQGVGSALIRHGTSQADRDGAFCWVHSSDTAWKMFAKEGFNEVGRLTVDLDKVAREEQGDSKGNGVQKEPRGWGHYTFRYMKRLPMASVPT